MKFQQPHFNVTVLNPADLILKDEDGRVNTKKVFIKRSLHLNQMGTSFYKKVHIYSYNYFVIINTYEMIQKIYKK
jgi:hypothetical protein